MATAPSQLPPVNLDEIKIAEDVLSIVPPEVARKFRVVAFEQSGQKVKLAVGDPGELRPDVKLALDEFAKKKGLTIELFASSPAAIEAALTPKTAPVKNAPKPPGNLASAVPFINLTTQMIPREVLEKFPREIAEKYDMVVFEASPGKIKVAAVAPGSHNVKDILRFIKERNEIDIELYQINEESLRAALKQYEVTKPVIATPPPKPEIAHKPTLKAPPIRQVQREVHEKEEIVPAEPETRPIEELYTPSQNGAPKEGETKTILPAPQIAKDERNLDQLIGKKITTVADLETLIKRGQVQVIVGGLIALAVEMRASDIHLEALEKRFRLRYRVDGILRHILYMPKTLHPPIISRIKILAEMKIDEQRIPQDGRYDVVVGDKEIDLRVSTLPTVFGEKIVIRLLSKSLGILTLTQLGLAGRGYETVMSAIKKPYGVVLATGPTGSGKSTTLYAVLKEIATPEVNVITLEDPVEYEIEGINQSQVKPNIGFSFAEGLRSVLRQDPNIIMVGEVRDGETAGMVTHAALTGHLVLSTLHTNDASGALPRLINMGVEPFLITSSMNCVIAQRLVRKICPHCKKPVEIPTELTAKIKREIEKAPSLKKAIGEKALKFYKGMGCRECSHGYLGRIGIFEVLAMSEAVEALALKNAPASAILEQATKEGMLTMFQDGIVKAVEGVTTLDEVFRVTSTNIEG